MIVDAAALLAFFDRSASNHWAVMGEIELAAGFERLVVSPFVIAELEIAVRREHGPQGWLTVLDELAGGAWTIASVTPGHLAAMSARVASGASLAEASVAALAKRDE